MIPHHFRMHYVYVIKNKATGQQYIGYSIEFLNESGGG